MGLLEALGWIVTALVEASPGAQRSPRSHDGDAGSPTVMRDDGPPIRPAIGPPEPDRAAPAAASAPTVLATTTTDADLGWRAKQLRACRTEVAAARRVCESNVSPGPVLLRWTVPADGTVRDTEVVALADTDPAVVECIERKMSGWTFPRRPETAPVHLEYQLNLATGR